MSESLMIVMITSMGGTFLTVVGAIIQQSMSLKRAAIEQQATKKVTTETKTAVEETKTIAQDHRSENQESFDDLKTLIMTQNTIIDLILRDRLRFLLQQHQGKTSVHYADKEIIVEMHSVYKAKGYNGTIDKMLASFDDLPVV